MTRNRTAFLALVLVAALAVSAAGPAYIPIAAARQQAQGSTVTVMGLVTVPSGDFKSSSGDEGFAIQDQTGGIWISVTKQLFLKLGQRVQVTGVLGTSENKLQLVPAKLSDVKVLPGSQLRVATGQVGTATLGYVVTVEGTVTDQGMDDDMPYGHKFWIDDGSGPAQIYLNLATGIDWKAPYFKPGSRLRITGFGNQYSTVYEVDPRSRKDVVVLNR